MRRLVLALLVVGSGLAGALPAQGPEGGNGLISGRVTRDDGSGVADATVVLTGPPPVLRRATTTDEHGRFQFPALPDGVYAVEASHPNTSTAVAERLRLRAGELLRQTLQVKAGSPGTLSVSAQPLLDVTTPNRPRSQDTPHLFLLPGDRTNDASLPRLAGIEEDRQSKTTTGAEPLLVVEGLSAAEAALFVDGLDLTDRRTGLPTQRVPVDLIDTQQTLGPARSADSRSASGASISVLTRRPAQTWQGGITLRYGDDRLRAGARSSIASEPARDAAWDEALDVGLWAGGPLVAKRAWLALGAAPHRAEVGPTDDVDLPANGRLTLRPAANVTLRFAAVLDDAESPGTSSIASSLSAEEQQRKDSDTRASGLVLDWVATPALTLQVTGERFALRRELHELETRTLAENEDQQRRDAGVHLDLTLPGSGLHALSFGSRWSALRTEVGAPVPPPTSGVVHGDELAVFVRDAVQVSRRFTLDLGLRSETSRARRRGSPQVIEFDLVDTIAPRLGLAFDVRGDGQWKAYGQAAWITPPVLHQLPLAAFVAGLDAEVDPELEPPRAFAAVLGIDHLLLPTVRVGAELSFHSQLEGVSLMQLAVAEDGTAPIGAAVVNPGTGLAARPYGPDFPSHPGLERDYAALTITAAALFPRWSGRFSYVYSRLDGTWNGLANADDAANPVSPYTNDTCSTLEGCFTAQSRPARGRLAADRPHELKLSGHLRLHERFTLGGFFRFESGTPFARQVPLLTTLTTSDESEVLTRLFHPEGRESEERLPRRAQVDLRLQYEILSRPRGRGLVVFADLQNVFDDQSVQSRWPVAYLGAVEVDRAQFFDGFDPDALAAMQGLQPDPRFGKGLRYAAPRRLHLGLRWEW